MCAFHMNDNIIAELGWLFARLSQLSSARTREKRVKTKSREMGTGTQRGVFMIKPFCMSHDRIFCDPYKTRLQYNTVPNKLSNLNSTYI